MELTNTFEIPAPAGEAWKVLQDIERIAPCMPGATLESAEGDEYGGKVKVKVGPVTVTYRGTAQFIDLDETAHRAVIKASGKEMRGTGTARATVTTELVDKGEATEVNVHTDLYVTGKPAQFGRGVMADVATKLIDQFASCVAEELTGRQRERPAAEEQLTRTALGEPRISTTPAAGGPAITAEPSAAAGAEMPHERRSAEAIDLVKVAGAPVAKRLAPIAVAAALLLIVRLLRRGR
jgi:carbon monoxide dehydrogenase subunit G